jgi:hypothetical protein
MCTTQFLLVICRSTVSVDEPVAHTSFLCLTLNALIFLVALNVK